MIEQTHQFIDWVFFGDQPANIKPELIEFHKPVDFLKYPAYLQQLNLDLAVAPLINNAFNNAKSPLKLLEFGVLGIPVIASNLACYNNSPAILLDNNPDIWVAKLVQLDQNRNNLSIQGNSLQQWVHQSFWLEQHLSDWRKLFELS